VQTCTAKSLRRSSCRGKHYIGEYLKIRLFYIPRTWDQGLPFLFGKGSKSRFNRAHEGKARSPEERLGSRRQQQGSIPPENIGGVSVLERLTEIWQWFP
jgi:hypothetical protein